MEPQIQYAQTTDGVSIAYTRGGAGTPLVMVPNLCFNIGFYHRIEPGLLTNNIARGREVVLVDGRGTGASQRDVAEVSLEARLSDLEAVVDHLDLQSMIMMGMQHGGPAAIAYAARHPERVASLMLAHTYANGDAYYTLAPVMRVFSLIGEMASERWEFYTRTAANAVLGYGHPDLAERLAELHRDSITPEVLIRYREASRAIDVTPLLADVGTRTLVLDDRNSPLRVEALSRDLAAGIPGARLVTYEGSGLTASDPMIAAMDDFLGTEAPPPQVETAPRLTPSAMTAVLFADIVDSTGLTERMGDAAFRERARTLDASLRAIITEAGGTAIDGFLSGDGVLATFPAASQAIDAALRCTAAGDEQSLPLHLGLHAGDVIREQNNVFGGAVNIASRISALSAPGEVLVSDVVRALARTSAAVTFEDRGEHALKGVGEPQRVYAVRKGAE